MHPRLSVNAICSMNQALEDDLVLWADLGIDNVGLISPKLELAGWDVARQIILDAGLSISSMSCYRDGIVPSLEFAGAIGTSVLYIITGSAGSTPWEEAAAKFCEELAPHVARGKELGVRLALEPTNPLRTDVSFVHCVRDAMDLAVMADMGVVVDFYSSWYERGLDELVRKHIELVGLVQICDYKLGTFDMPNRSAIGEGNIPVERMMGLMLDAGYEGPFDLEILGPRIEAAGYRDSIATSIERAGEMLNRLGA
jgi:sugar phosphate isomerase/epimerase